MDCETPLQQAADAVLQRNALIVTTLDGASLPCLLCLRACCVALQALR
jgi:hypothetical protein